MTREWTLKNIRKEMPETKDMTGVELESYLKLLGKSLDDFTMYDAGYSEGGGFEWCIAHWGTKWNCYHQRTHHTKSSLFYNFHSAWSPPIPVVIAMSAKFPKLKFTLKYYERGMRFKGVLIVKNEEIIVDTVSDYCGRRGG